MKLKHLIHAGYLFLILQVCFVFLNILVFGSFTANVEFVILNGLVTFWATISFLAFSITHDKDALW